MAEYKTLVSNRPKIVSLISADPLLVGNTLAAKGLVPPVSVDDSRSKEKMATDLVQQVSQQVQVFPEKFYTFVAALREFTWLDLLAKLLEKEVCTKIIYVVIRCEMTLHGPLFLF